MSKLAPLAVYIHWPYCARICPYCDFNVYKSRAQNQETELLAAIVQDLTAWREMSGPREIISIHFGGGTPSLMTAAQIGQLIAQVESLWGISAQTEIALEANPSDANPTRWREYRAAGIGRLSLGIQSFDDDVLARLGRDHNGDASRAALALAMDIFPSVSADMIFGHSGQTLTHWQGELEQVLALAPHHISAYQLTIEPGTAFARAESRGQERAVDDEQSAALYEYALERLSTAGYSAYEVSNHAVTGHSSRHNLAYWQGLDYVGVGPGAHGRLLGRLLRGRLTHKAAHGRIAQKGAREATIAAKRPADYIKRVAQTGNGITRCERLSPEQCGQEYVMMGLRIRDGISLARFADYAGADLPRDVIAELSALGLIVHEGDNLRATDTGRLVLNTVSAQLLGA